MGANNQRYTLIDCIKWRGLLKLTDVKFKRPYYRDSPVAVQGQYRINLRKKYIFQNIYLIVVGGSRLG
jgi:hypothetical protein